MHDEFHKAAVVACRLILKPLISVLLRLGISYGAFCDIAKRVYVDVAMDSSPSKRNVSDVAVRTGISRKEVGKVLDAVEELPALSSNKLAINNVIDTWYKSPKFQDNNGRPAPLPFNSESAVDLMKLVRTTKIDIPVSTVLKLLLSSGAIKAVDSDVFLPKSLLHLTEGLDHDEVLRIGNVLFGFINTIKHNYLVAPILQQPRMIERRAFTSALPRDKIRPFIKFSENIVTPVMNELDNWLDNNSAAKLTNNPNQGVTGVGFYTFDCTDMPYS